MGGAQKTIGLAFPGDPNPASRALHGFDTAFWQCGLPIPDSLLHTNAEGGHSSLQCLSQFIQSFHSPRAKHSMADISVFKKHRSQSLSMEIQALSKFLMEVPTRPRAVLCCPELPLVGFHSYCDHDGSLLRWAGGAKQKAYQLCRTYWARNSHCVLRRDKS